MSKDLIIALLALAFAGCAGALLVALAKLDEWKERAADEHENHVAALRIGNANAEYAQRLEKELERSKARDCQGHIDFLNFCVDTLEKKNAALQDRLSALRCPRNDHIWVGGVCKRCGRAQPLPELFGIIDYGASGDPGTRGMEE